MIFNITKFRKNKFFLDKLLNPKPTRLDAVCNTFDFEEFTTNTKQELVDLLTEKGWEVKTIEKNWKYSGVQHSFYLTNVWVMNSRNPDWEKDDIYRVMFFHTQKSKGKWYTRAIYVDFADLLSLVTSPHLSFSHLTLEQHPRFFEFYLS